MNSKIKIMRYILLFVIIIFNNPFVFSAQNEDDTLKYLLKLSKDNPSDPIAKERIYLKNNVMYCTGDSKVAVENNKAADLMEKLDYEKATAILENALKHAALFFPFRYNLGICYLHQDKLKRALLHFKKAQAVVPEYSHTYLQIGYIYQRWHRDSEAIEYFREGLKRNKKNLNAYILIGDVFFNRNQMEMAKKYYDASLKIEHRFPNGILGRAKIHFKDSEYHKALVLLKSIDITKEYDKAYHYYYAELAFKLKDYKTAAEHYKILLNNKSDKFFLTNSISLIKLKLNLSERFVEK